MFDICDIIRYNVFGADKPHLRKTPNPKLLLPKQQQWLSASFKTVSGLNGYIVNLSNTVPVSL